MIFSVDTDVITHGIQLAVAPVFLLTAVTGMIGAAAGRLARIVDRARVLEDRIEVQPEGSKADSQYAELRHLRRRGILVNSCIALLTCCAILIGLTIIVLFLGETTAWSITRTGIGFFLAAVVSFLLALLAFFTETLMATRMLRFRRRPRVVAL